MSNKTFKNGIHPDACKEITAGSPIKRLPFAPRIILLLRQHIGKPAKVLCAIGDEVRRGQLVAEADGFVSAPIHSPVNGVIKSIAKTFNQNGELEDAIFIETHENNSSLDWKKDINSDLLNLSSPELIKLIQKAGIVGLGGAAFPAHVKYSVPAGKVVDTLIVNGSECEPYLTSDYRVMLECPEQIVFGAKLVMRVLGVNKAIIGIEDNKPEAIKALRNATATEREIRVEVCKTKYPQGAEKMLIKALLGREVPSGGLPADAGVVCSNVTTLAEISNLLSTESGMVERVVTITGEGVENPGNYIIPIGTPLSFILDQVGLKTDTYEILFGGPMMGKSVSYLGTPTIKGTSGIVVLTRAELSGKITYNEINPCIRCGECLKVCPMHLNPSQLGRLGRKRKYKEMVEKYHLNDCFECGCCTYVCTAGIPLVQQFKIAKQVIKGGF